MYINVSILTIIFQKLFKLRLNSDIMEPIFHIILPALLLMVLFPRFSKKKIIIMAVVIEVLMDIDNYVNHYHRILTHNIFYIALLAIIFYFLINKQFSYMAIYYGLSHLILDLWAFGVAFLWPFVNYTFAMDINASMANPYFFSFAFKMFPFSILRAEKYTSYYLTQWGTSLLILIGLAVLVWYILKKKNIIKNS